MTILTEQKHRLEYAYIITVTSSRTSVSMANKLLRTCNQNSIPAKIWEAVDGTLPKNLQKKTIRGTKL